MSKERNKFRFQSIVSSIIFFGTIALVVYLVAIRKKPEQQVDLRKAPLVELAAVGSYTEDVKISVTGVTVPFREITIAAEVTGVVTEKFDECRAGRYVEAGTPLLSIDPTKYRLAVERLEFEVKEAFSRKKRVENELKTAEELLKLAKNDFELQTTERDKRDGLFQSKVISLTEWNQAQMAYNAAQTVLTNQQNRYDTLINDIAVQTNQWELKKVQLEEAKIDFAKANIQAPTKGVVISDDVQKDDFVQVGKQLLVFEDTEAAEVKCDLRSDQLQAILDTRTGEISEQDRFRLPKKPATITYNANGRSHTWNGVLERYDGLGLSDRTRTAPCRILVKNTFSEDGKRTLIRGMYVSVQINLGQQDGLVAIPAEALRAGEIVWVYNPGMPEKPTADEASGSSSENQENKIVVADGEEVGTLKKLNIEVVDQIVDSRDDKIVIARMDSKSFSPGARLVLSPIPQPTEGMLLRHKKDQIPVPWQPKDAQKPSTTGGEKSQQSRAGKPIKTEPLSRQKMATEDRIANLKTAGKEAVQ